MPVVQTSTTDAVRVAVVGAGGWGEQHARIFSRRPDTELCAVVGRTPAKTATRAAAYGAPAYTDIDTMLAEQRPDLVTVSLPNEGHFEPTLHLIRAGVPLLVEKPLVFSLSEADVLLAEAAARDLFFAINFNQRYAEPVQRARRAIQAGELGDLVFSTWRFGGEGSYGTSRHANLIETQCHGLDMLEYLCGPIVSVMAQMTDKTTADRIPGAPYTTLAVALEFADGAVGTLLGSYDSSYAYPGAQHVEINGTTGRAVIEDTVRSLSLSTSGDETTKVWQAGYFNDEARTFTYTFDRHVDALLDAFRAGAEPPVHARAGRRVLVLAEAIIASFERGARVPTEPDVPAR
jgi:predicted dehydrogenase